MTSSTDSEDFEVELVQVLFRHGDRTPDKSEIYPKDPDKEFDYQPFGHGQLTNEGKRRSFKLGQILRNRYGTFLGDYRPENVYAYSTFYDRCKTSLQLVLAGLFPATPELTWNENLPWTPIPFESNPAEKEIFYEAVRNSKFLDLIKEARQSPAIVKRTEKYNEILDYLSEATRQPKIFGSLSKLFNNVETKKAFGFPLPHWCDEKLYEDLKEAHEILYDIFSYNNDSKKLWMGKFLEKVVENINGSEKKIHLYCAHDVTVYIFLKSHNINSISHVDFSGTVVLEKLRGKKDNKQYIRLLFWPGNGDDFQVLKFEDCDEVCTLEKYLEIIDPVLPKKDDELFDVNTGEIKWYITESLSNI